jgi:hypothetical protein
VQREEAAFLSQFGQSALHIARALQDRLGDKGAAAATLAQFVAASAPFATSFPNVTLSSWATLGEASLPLFSARAMCWLPLVPPGAARLAWEAYASATLGAALAPPTGIYVSGANGTRTRATDSSGGMLVPLWQIAPPTDSNNAARLLNLASVPVELVAMEAAAATGKPCVCDTLVLVQDKAAAALGAAPRPSSIVFAPVLRGANVSGFASVVFSWDDALLNALPELVSDIDAVLRSNVSGSSFSFRISGDTVINTGAGAVYESADALAGLAQSYLVTLGGAQSFWLTLYPTAALRDSHLSGAPGAACAVVVCIIFATSLLFWLYDAWASGRSARLRGAFLLTRRVVDDLFPEQVRERMLQRHVAAAAAAAAASKQPAHKRATRSQSPSTAGSNSDRAISGGGSTALATPQRGTASLPPDIEQLNDELARAMQPHTSAAARGQALLRRMGLGCVPRMSLALPSRISAAAAAVQEPIADGFPAVSVLFADVCQFTRWAGGVPPAFVFTVLEALFNDFDALAAQYGVFKVETSACGPARACSRAMMPNRQVC